jgi:Peptide methionine sulfoxide reductase
MVLKPGKQRCFFESQYPTQGMGQGNDVGTQYRSVVFAYDEAQRQAAVAAREAYQVLLSHAGWPDHDRGPRRTGVLLRRALSPAISRQEPPGLLRPERHRDRLPGRYVRRCGGDRLASAGC